MALDRKIKRTMIYVDAGCYNGDTVEQFVNWGQLFGDISNSEVYGFDPNPNFDKEWEDIIERQSQHVKKMEFYKKAAWIEPGTMEFSLSDIGSTLMKEKNTWDNNDVIEVETFDLSEWLTQFRGLEVCLKLDIEGAEYEVLKKMIGDGTDAICELMFIEWHGSKMSSYRLDEQRWIKDNLKCGYLEWR